MHKELQLIEVGHDCSCRATVYSMQSHCFMVRGPQMRIHSAAVRK
jgi:hypothetical protein